MQPAQRIANNFFCGLHKTKAFSIKNATKPMYWITFCRFLGKKKRDFDKFSSNRCKKKAVLG